MSKSELTAASSTESDEREESEALLLLGLYPLLGQGDSELGLSVYSHSGEFRLILWLWCKRERGARSDSLCCRSHTCSLDEFEQ